MDEQPQIDMADSTDVSVPEAQTASIGKSGVLKFEKMFLPLAILAAAVMISGTLLYTKQNGGPSLPGAPTPPVKVDISIDDDPMLGNKNAKVTIVEFSDFQCPFCRKFWKESYASLKQDYIDTGKVRLVFRDFPLQFHPAAQPSAEAGGCANEQGKFWEYHDKMFIEQAKQGEGTITYGVVELKKWARELGLDTAKFNQCLDSSKYKSEVEKDVADGSKAGVSGTPSFFINGILTVGAQPYAVFKQLIDDALK